MFWLTPIHQSIISGLSRLLFVSYGIWPSSNGNCDIHLCQSYFLLLTPYHMCRGSWKSLFTNYFYPIFILWLRPRGSTLYSSHLPFINVHDAWFYTGIKIKYIILDIFLYFILGWFFPQQCLKKKIFILNNIQNSYFYFLWIG